MNELKFFESLFLFLFSTISIWVMSIPWTVLMFIANKIELAILFLILSIVVFVAVFPVTMCRIILNEKGVQKSLLKRFKRQFFAWESIQDCVIVTRPNGYAYIVVAQEKIKHTSFNEVSKNKKCLYFTYNQKALDFIKEHVKLEEEKS